MVTAERIAKSSPTDREELPASSGLLLERWRSGDREAFTLVVQRFQGPLLSYVFHRIRNIQDAEDAVQEAFIRAFRSIHQLRDTEKLWEWLKQIAHNAAMDMVHRAERRGIPTDPASIQEMGDERQSVDADNGHLPDSDPQDLSLQMIIDAIEELPATYKQAAIYHFLQEWPYSKIGETMGLEPAAVRQRVSRGSRMLRTILTGRLRA